MDNPPITYLVEYVSVKSGLTLFTFGLRDRRGVLGGTLASLRPSTSVKYA